MTSKFNSSAIGPRWSTGDIRPKRQKQGRASPGNVRYSLEARKEVLNKRRSSDDSIQERRKDSAHSALEYRRSLGEISVTVNDDVDDVVVHLHRKSISQQELLPSEDCDSWDAESATNQVGVRSSCLGMLSPNGQLAEDYDWLRRDSFLHELQSEVDPDIIQEEIKRLEEKKPKTCRRRMVRVLKSTPIVSILLFLIILDAAIVLAQLVLDIRASYDDFQDMKKEANDIMIFVNATHASQLAAAGYYGSNVQTIMRILRNNSGNGTAGAAGGGQRRRLLAAPPSPDSPPVAGVFVFQSGYSHWHHIVHILHLASIVILGILLVEVILKIIGLGFDFLKYKIEVIDAIIVTASFILDIVFLNSNMSKTITVMIILILWRIVRLLNAVIVQEKQRLKFLLRVTKASNTTAKQRITILNDSLKAKHKEIQTLRNLCSILGGSEPPLKQSKKPPVVKKKRPSSGLSPLLMSALSATTLGLLPSVNNNNNGSNSASNSPFSTPFSKRKKSKTPPRVHSLSTSAIDCSEIGQDEQQLSNKLKSSKSALNGASASVDNLSPPPDYNSIMMRKEGTSAAKANGSVFKSVADSSDNVSDILINSSNQSTPSHGVSETARKDKLNLLVCETGDDGIDNEAFAQSPEVLEPTTTIERQSSAKKSLMSWFFPKKKVKRVIPEVRVHEASPAAQQSSNAGVFSLRESKSDSELMSTPDRSRRMGSIAAPNLVATPGDAVVDSESELSSVKSDRPVFDTYNSSLSSRSSSGSFSRACLQHVSKISGGDFATQSIAAGRDKPPSRINDAFPLLSDTAQRAATLYNRQNDDVSSSDTNSPVKVIEETDVDKDVIAGSLATPISGRSSAQSPESPSSSSTNTNVNTESSSDISRSKSDTNSPPNAPSSPSSFVIDIDRDDNSKSNAAAAASAADDAEKADIDGDDFCITKL
ncbi:uncharacterized protein LOC141913043 [Tubulanus polymorphus]|uniref:uncharacterized protein LOC141913043 n=1 Tax=Tubulanus polymorphus TaxID=672921 RepID=UPI003DA5F6FC